MDWIRESRYGTRWAIHLRWKAGPAWTFASRLHGKRQPVRAPKRWKPRLLRGERKSVRPLAGCSRSTNPVKEPVREYTAKCSGAGIFLHSRLLRRQMG